jgi:hypothetical protein
LAFSHCGVTQKTDKFQICVDFQNLNVTTKKMS